MLEYVQLNIFAEEETCFACRLCLQVPDEDKIYSLFDSENKIDNTDLIECIEDICSMKV